MAANWILGAGSVCRMLCSPMGSKLSSKIIRQVSTINTNKVHYTKINANLELLYKHHSASGPRPLVLLFAWLAAKGRHKKKYADYYLNKGFDVLHVSLKPTQVLLPSLAQDNGKKLVELLHEHKVLRTQQIVVHTFSVGAYAYAECIVECRKRAEELEPLTSRIRGLIYDSPVGRHGIADGLPKALTKNKNILKISSGVLNWYLKTFYNQITQYYDTATETALRNDLRVPVLFLYSLADPVGSATQIEEWIRIMKGNDNADILHQCWETSPHVSHMLHHPQEYMSAVNEFIDLIGLAKQCDREKKKAISL